MQRLAVIAVLVVAACGSVGPAQPHTLSLSYKAGDTYKYRFHSSAKQTAAVSGLTVPINIETTADESVKVSSVTGSGDALLALTLTNVTVKSSMGGVTNTTTGTPGGTVDVEVAPDGRLVSVEGNQAATSTPLLAFTTFGSGLFVTAVLPDHAVKPGDTWTKDYDQVIPGNGAGVHITTKSTYLRDESVGGVDAAVVETKSTGTVAAGTAGGSSSPAGMPAINGTLETDVTTWIDPAGHRIVKSHATATNDLTVSLPAEAAQPPVSVSPAPGLPPFAGGLSGPIAVKGTATTDLDPG